MGVLRNLCSLIYDIYVDMLKIGDSSQLLVDHRAVRTSFESDHVHAAEGLSWTPIFKDTQQPSFPRT